MVEFYTFEDKRDFICQLVQSEKNLVGAEIGVWKGDTTAYLLDRLPNLKMIGIDPYYTGKTDDADLKKFGVQHWLWFDKNEDANAMYETTKGRLSQYGERATLLRQASVEAAKNFSDEFFDFVYIDANHFYEQVKADILAWLPKVKAGGWLLGDDFSWLLRQDQVTKAVMEAFSYNYGVMADTWFVKKT